MWFSNFLTKIALFSNIKPIVFGVYFVWRCKIVPSREELCDLLFCVAVCIIVSRAHCEGGVGMVNSWFFSCVRIARSLEFFYSMFDDIIIQWINV